ncbi:MAG: GH3 auxin-responsive promoter family protein [Bergeyella sp.]|nr:GH3 auxin-responsive promoter family protein [Bergeyella sp.]
MATRSIFNSVVNWFIKDRIDRIGNFLKEPIETQNSVLFSLLEKSKHTVYGRKHGFKDIDNLSDFQSQVPIVRYEDFEPYIERTRRGEPNVIWNGKIKQFAKSSGTTNAKSKYIPITEESLRDCHFRAGKDLISIYCNNHPKNQLFSNKNLRLGGSAELYENYNTKYGDLSAILIDNLPFWIEITTTPSKKTSLMTEWEAKIKAIVAQVKKENVGSISGVPSWMLILLKKILEESNKSTIAEIWSQLEVFFHGGISFKPYKEEYRKIIGKEINFYEIYNASEGFFAMQDRCRSDELLLMLDYGIFYEFIKLQDLDKEFPRAYTLGEVEPGENYAVVISSNGGLWRYLLGDTIYFTSIAPHRLKISGRTKHFINTFGEELMIDNVEKALEKACKATQAVVREYTGAPIFMSSSSQGGHEWLIEFSKKPKKIEDFNTIFDEELQKVNSDYEAKRYKDITLKKPVIHVGKDRVFYVWMSQRGKLGGQNKVPRLSNTREYIEPLLSLNQKL